MKQKLLMLFFPLFFIFIGLAPKANADGFLVPPPNHYVQELGQKAVIVHENNQEELILSVEFQGTAEDFAWIVPTPSKPEVNRSTDEIFTGLEALTKVSDPFPTVLQYAPAASQEKSLLPVTVVETKKVDLYDVTVLKARDSKELAKWLNDNKYVYPEKEAYLFDSYIQKGWYFVTAKVNAKYLETEAAQKLKSGHATPLKLVFSTDKIVFPLRLSSIQVEQNKVSKTTSGPSASSSGVGAVKPDEETLIAPLPYTPIKAVPITLYVFAETKKTIPGFTTSYASFIDAKEAQELAMIDGGSWRKFTNRTYLTKLYRSMSFSEMTDDLYARDAKDQKSVNAGPSRGGIFLTTALSVVLTILVFVVSPCGLIFIIGSFLHLSQKKKANVVGWVMQFISASLNFISAAVIAGYLLIQENEIELQDRYALIGVACALGFLLLVQVLIMVIQKIKLAKRELPQNKKKNLSKKKKISS